MILNSNPRPVTDYAEAVAGVAGLQALDDEHINPLCRTSLLTHGERRARAVVFLHGYTNCPRQFYRLAQDCFERDCNVLVPRLPQHGLADRLCAEPAGINAGEMAAFTDRALDLAHGLGEHVCVAGISLGANLALWAAQQRADVARAVAIAPVLLPRNVPAGLVPLLRALLARLPNFFIWWDRRHKARLPGPAHAYPRFATRGVAAALAFARDVQRRALDERQLPRAGAVTLVTNANDPAVDNRATHALADGWRRLGAENVTSYEFAAALGLVHDLVDPDQVGQRTDVVYPVLMRLIAGD